MTYNIYSCKRFGEYKIVADLCLQTLFSFVEAIKWFYVCFSAAFSAHCNRKCCDWILHMRITELRILLEPPSSCFVGDAYWLGFLYKKRQIMQNWIETNLRLTTTAETALQISHLRLSRCSGSFHVWISVWLNRMNIKFPQKYTPADMKNTRRHSDGSLESFTTKPTNNGAIIDMILAAALVRPISVPAKFGAMSMWFT